MNNSGDTLFFDGQCSLCNAEMEQLRKVKPDSLDLVDIHSLNADESLPDREALLRQLHLRTADGTLLIGLDANIAAWQDTPAAARWRLLNLPLVRPVANFGYRCWARWRYRRLYAKSRA